MADLNITGQVLDPLFDQALKEVQDRHTFVKAKLTPEQFQAMKPIILKHLFEIKSPTAFKTRQEVVDYIEEDGLAILTTGETNKRYPTPEEFQGIKAKKDQTLLNFKQKLLDGTITPSEQRDLNLLTPGNADQGSKDSIISEIDKQVSTPLPTDETQKARLASQVSPEFNVPNLIPRNTDRNKITGGVRTGILALDAAALTGGLGGPAGAAIGATEGASTAATIGSTALDIASSVAQAEAVNQANQALGNSGNNSPSPGQVTPSGQITPQALPIPLQNIPQTNDSFSFPNQPVSPSIPAAPLPTSTVQPNSGGGFGAGAGGSLSNNIQPFGLPPGLTSPSTTPALPPKSGILGTGIGPNFGLGDLNSTATAFSPFIESVLGGFQAQGAQQNTLDVQNLQNQGALDVSNANNAAALQRLQQNIEFNRQSLAAQLIEAQQRAKIQAEEQRRATIQGAFTNLINGALSGRTGEANSLTNLAGLVQKPLL